MSVEKYLELNGKYLREAEEFLTRGDLTQASEKLWGAAAEILKAVAAKRGMEIGTHASLWEYLSKLTEEHPDWGLTELFAMASALHTNFYEGWMTLGAVQIYAGGLGEFVGKLRRLL